MPQWVQRSSSFFTYSFSSWTSTPRCHSRYFTACLICRPLPSTSISSRPPFSSHLGPEDVDLEVEVLHQAVGDRLVHHVRGEGEQELLLGHQTTSSSADVERSLALSSGSRATGSVSRNSPSSMLLLQRLGHLPGLEVGGKGGGADLLAEDLDAAGAQLGVGDLLDRLSVPGLDGVVEHRGEDLLVA